MTAQVSARNLAPVIAIDSDDRELGPQLLDVIVAAIALALSLSTAAFAATKAGEPDLPVPAIIVQVACAAALLWRRRFPVPVWLLVGIGAALYGSADWADPLLPFTPLVALAGVFEFAARTTRFAVLAVTVVTAAIGTALTADSDPLDWWIVVLVLIGAPLTGAYLRTRRELIVELRARADHLETVRLREIEGARAAERARVARELHDVVAHHVTLLVVQAEAAASTAAMDESTRRATFDSLAHSGREAMTELRLLIGLLRGDERAPISPRPGLARLGDLIDGVQASGLRVDASIIGSTCDLPSAVDLAAYRVIQESLTNVLKHAPTSSAVVSIDIGPGEVVIVVDNDGDERAGSPARDTRPGTGLIGLRERVELLGGQFSYVLRPLGGFRVEASIPR